MEWPRQHPPGIVLSLGWLAPFGLPRLPDPFCPLLVGSCFTSQASFPILPLQTVPFPSEYISPSLVLSVALFSTLAVEGICRRQGQGSAAHHPRPSGEPPTPLLMHTLLPLHVPQCQEPHV